MVEIIDGKLVSKTLRDSLVGDIAEFSTKYGVTPGLAVVVVGNNPASAVYVRNKHKACLECGINSFEVALPEQTSEECLLEKIKELNADPKVHGILVQLPLPSHISEDKVIDSISPKKDVDAFHPENVGRILIGKYSYLPCTPAGIMDLLEFYNINPEGKECVIIGRSNIVGKPMSLLMLSKNATVTIAHSRTKNLSEVTKRADILIVAIGKAKFVTADMVKKGAVVIDVGINRLDNGKLAGDVDFENVAPKASFITPVPGGVGPMTITTLLKNTLTAARLAVEEK